MPTTKQTYGRVSLLLVAFALSGASGLILQILWTLTVSTFFGVSAHAIATILAAFMGGLALGSWMGNRIVSKSSLSPLLLYAISEVIVVVSAISIQLFFTYNSSLAHWMATYLSGYTSGALFLRFLLLGLLLLIPTSAMGASFPFFLRALVPKSGLIDLRTVSAAYGCNVLGAAAGCFLTASVFLMKWGIPKTVFLACCMNGMAALIAYSLRRPVSEAVHQPKQSPVFSTKVLYFLVTCSGFSAMAFEVLWSRIYRQALWLANPFQAFSYTLSLILIGMGIGSLLLLFVNRDRHSAIRLFAKLQWITAVFCILGITHIRWDVAFLFPGDPSFLYRTLSTLVLSGGAVTLGMGFPLLAKSHENIDKIGHLYALSALGGVLGTITGGFVLLPVLGVRGSLLFLSVGFVLTGILASQTQDARPWKLRRLPITIGLLTSLFTALGIGVATEDRIDFECHDCTLLWLNDGLEATTAVVRSAQGSTILYTDGRAIMPGALPQRTLTPFLVAPAIERVLSIGFGSGQLARLVAQSFPKSQVDCVELDGNMAQTTEFFGTSDIFSLPNFRLYIDDGRQHMLRSPQRYDLIMADTFTHSINTQIYGSGFFRVAKSALTDDGSFFITVPLQDLPSKTEAEVILRTAAASFPYTYILAPDGLVGIVGRNKPFPNNLSMRRLSNHLQRKLAFRLTQNDIFLVTPKVLSQFSSNRINSDTHPYFFPLMQRSMPGSGERMRQKIRNWGNLP